ncbi:MAG: M28 family peptidase [Acidobacteriia bacterium]|nr:M28 family peptidase [Terriglobia bacterium]
MRNAIRIHLILVMFASAACAQSPSAATPPLSGEKAMEHVRAQVAFGPRPPGSEALERCREYLVRQLEGFGYQVEKDTFEAATPYGPKKMVNLIARKKLGGDSIIAMASHYDTKYFEKVRFVGANDAGSSTGLLLELARVLAARKDSFDYWFLFLDGEEAFIDWSTFDSTYGSRHLAKRWQEEGTAPKVRALILLDMIGDKNLDLLKDTNSTPWLMDLVWNTAVEEGFRDILSNTPSAVEDDHIPFLDVKIPCVDIIDLNYTPWHTEGDTLDKISAASMEKVGKLVLAVLPKLERRLTGR